MTTNVRAEVKVPRPVDAVFDLAAGHTENLARFFTGDFPLIPGIKRASLVGRDDPPEAGTLRDVDLSDGSAIQERVLAFEAPRRHRYEMARMNGLQRLICTNMVSEWRFDPEGDDACRVVWEYAIHEKGALGRLLVRPVAWSFQRAMQTCLDNVRRAAIAG